MDQQQSEPDGGQAPEPDDETKAKALEQAQEEAAEDRATQGGYQ